MSLGYKYREEEEQDARRHRELEEQNEQIRLEREAELSRREVLREAERVAEEEEQKRRRAEAEARRLEQEAKKLADEIQRLKEEAAKKAAEEAERLKEEARKAAEELEKRLAAEAEAKRIAEQARLAAEEAQRQLEEARKAAEEAKQKRLANEAALARKEEAARKRAEEAQRQREETEKAAEEAEKQREAAQRLAVEAEQKRLDAEAKAQAQQAEAQKLADGTHRLLQATGHVQEECQAMWLDAEVRNLGDGIQRLKNDLEHMAGHREEAGRNSEDFSQQMHKDDANEIEKESQKIDDRDVKKQQRLRKEKKEEDVYVRPATEKQEKMQHQLAEMTERLMELLAVKKVELEMMAEKSWEEAATAKKNIDKANEIASEFRQPFYEIEETSEELPRKKADKTSMQTGEHKAAKSQEEGSKRNERESKPAQEPAVAAGGDEPPEDRDNADEEKKNPLPEPTTKKTIKQEPKMTDEEKRAKKAKDKRDKRAAKKPTREEAIENWRKIQEAKKKGLADVKPDFSSLAGIRLPAIKIEDKKPIKQEIKDEEKDEHKVTPAERMRRSRAIKTEEEMKDIREKDRLRKQIKNENPMKGTRIKYKSLTPAEMAERRRQQNRDAQARRRMNETPAERAARLERDRARTRYTKVIGTARCISRHPVNSAGYRYYCGSKSANHWPNYINNGIIGKSSKGQDLICPHCKALLFETETPMQCCSEGKIDLEPLPLPPEQIQFLMNPTNPSPDAQELRKNIVGYSTALSFGCITGASRPAEGTVPLGPPLVILNGQQVQQIGNLQPPMSSDGETRRDPTFSQIYLEDADEALGIRMRNPKRRRLNPNLMRQLQKMIIDNNEFARFLQSLGDQLRLAEQMGGNVTNMRLVIYQNRPATGQVVVLIDPETWTQKNDIVLHTTRGDIVRINSDNRNADWIMYPLMFPYGTQTYSKGIAINKTKPGASAPIPQSEEEVEQALRSQVPMRSRNLPQPAEQEVRPPNEETIMDEPDEQEQVDPEPAGMDENIGHTDMEIPEEINRPEEDADEQGEVPEPPEEISVEERIRIAQEIRNRTHITPQHTQQLQRGIEEYLNASDINAYLAGMIHTRPTPAAVVFTTFEATINEPARNHVYGDLENPDLDVVLIPRAFAGGFTLGVYQRATGEVLHLDPRREGLNDELRNYYRRVVTTLNVPGRERFRTELPDEHITAMDTNMYNRQALEPDNGLWVALYAEQFLQRGRNNMYLANMQHGIFDQLRRVANYLAGIATGPLPTYEPLPAWQRHVEEMTAEEHVRAAMRIGNATIINQQTIENIRRDENQFIEAGEVDAALAAMTHYRRGAAAVVFTTFGTNRFHAEMGNQQFEGFTRARDYTYGNLDDPNMDVVLIPRLIMDGAETLGQADSTVGHFTLGAYFPRTGDLFHFDALRRDDTTRLTPTQIAYYRDVVATLNAPGTEPFLQPNVIPQPVAHYNQQWDGINCGFFVALFGELILTRGIEHTYVPNFGPDQLRQHRNRIAELLGEVATGYLPFYRPAPVSQQRIDEDYHPIGRSIPYNTDALLTGVYTTAGNPEMPNMEELNLEEDADDPVNEDDVDWEPRIQTVIDPARGCSKKKGPQEYCSRRQFERYHYQRRVALKRFHTLLSFRKLSQYRVVHINYKDRNEKAAWQQREQNLPKYRSLNKMEFKRRYLTEQLRRRYRNTPGAEQFKVGRVVQIPKHQQYGAENTQMNIQRGMGIQHAVNPRCGMFVTYTFNCKCPEMMKMRETTGNDNPADDFDLCCRLATVKFRKMTDHLLKKKLLGPVAGWVYSREYQKRGNKHWHLILMNKREDTNEQTDWREYIDEYISAEIPDKPTEGEEFYEQKMAYYKLVTSLYVHDCEDDENAACRAGRPNNDCRHGFPQPFQPHTVVRENGMVDYQRRPPTMGGNKFTKRVKTRQGWREKEIDNRYIAPHNRVLTLLMGSHVCVEFVTEYTLWFYLFKYAMKQDSQVIGGLYRQEGPNNFVADEYNQVREYHFMSPFEAMDNLRSEPWAGTSHDVMFLSVHLPGQENMTYQMGYDKEAMKIIDHPNFRSKWTAYMDLCSKDEHAATLKFDEIERDYTFHKEPEKGRWEFRERERAARGGMHIGWIYPPSPNNRELFATYLLALHLPGIKSYEDLRTVNRVGTPEYDPSRPTEVYPTAVRAAIARGLMKNDSVCHNTMDYVSRMMYRPYQLTNYFVTILLFADHGDALQLYNDFRDRMMLPTPRGQPTDRRAKEQNLLRRIKHLLEKNSRTMAMYNLPEPEADNRTQEQIVREDVIQPYFNENGEPMDEEQMPPQRRRELAISRGVDTLNNDQLGFFQQVINTRRDLQDDPNADNLLLLKGEGGTGKTYTLNVLIEWCNANQIPIKATATTGIAGTRLIGGVTAHSAFCIPVQTGTARLPDDLQPLSTMDLGSTAAEMLRLTEIIIIDEVGMMHMKHLTTIDMLLRDIHNTSRRFGGKIIIFTGDERQIMPILQGRDDPLGQKQAEASFFCSPLANLCQTYVLLDNMRLVEGQADHLAFTRKVGYDEIPHVRFPGDPPRPSLPQQHTRYIQVPDDYVRRDEKAAIEEIFPDEMLQNGDPIELTKRVILAPTNAVVDRLNDLMIERMPVRSVTDRRTYLSTNVPDVHTEMGANSIMVGQVLQNYRDSAMPPHELTLAVGMPVMCMQNLDVPFGVCNGTIMVVEELHADFVICRFMTRYGERRYPLLRTRFQCDKPMRNFCRYQIPLRIAFAVTINRAQGGTYDMVLYHAMHAIWAHGMLYTVLTRVREALGMLILCDSRRDYRDAEGKVWATTRNVVHPRISRQRTDVEAEPSTVTPGQSGDIVEVEEPFQPDFADYLNPREQAEEDERIIEETPVYNPNNMGEDEPMEEENEDDEDEEQDVYMDAESGRDNDDNEEQDEENSAEDEFMDVE